MQFKDVASAAKAAAQSAKDAIAAAQAAAELANKDSLTSFTPNNYTTSARIGEKDLGHHQRQYESQSFERLGHSNSTGFGGRSEDGEKDYNRRHTYNVPPRRHSDIKFDESDCDEEIEMEQPSSNGKEQNQHPRIHPKLPDYDILAARFEALKYRKPKT